MSVIKYKNPSTGLWEPLTAVKILTAGAEETPVNRLPLAIDTDNTVYNGVGYKAGYRISTSDGSEQAQEGMYISGFIPFDGDSDTVVLKNIGVAAVDYSASNIIGYQSLDTGSLNRQIQLDTLTPDGEGCYRITPDMWPASGYSRKWFRLSCSWLGEDTEIYVE